MNMSNLIPNTSKVFQEKGPEILTGVGIAGVVTTAFLAAKAAFRAAYLIEDDVVANLRAFPDVDYKPTFKDSFQLTWHLYIPAVVTGVGTITCVMLASRGNAKRTAAAVTAYSISERAFSEYREKVVEQLGKNKDQKVQDAIAQDYVTANPPPQGPILVLGRPEVLCCELHTGRYFECSVETLNQAKNEVNHWINTDRKATLNDFYDAIGLAPTDSSGKMGWTDEELMDLVFSHALTDEKSPRPCLTIRYNYLKPLV